MAYKKILLAVDLAADNEKVIDKAQQIREDDGAELMLIHVHEPTLYAYQGGGMAAANTQTAALDEEVRKVAEKKLAELADRLDVPKDKTLMPFGRASSEIKRAAEDKGVDLIVIGTHGRSGVGLILGSTANGVLHGCKCDVLAVKTG